MSTRTNPSTGSRRKGDLVELVLGIGIVLLVLFIGSFFRLRLDLTSEKRYTLRPATEELAKGLEDIVYVKVYLTGALPADLERLSQATRDLLDELRVHAGDNIQYSFIDPSESTDQKTRNEFYDQLQKAGLTYSSIRLREKAGYSEVIVFPGALVTYRDRTVPVQLLKTQLRTPDADIVNRSINNLEYELASAIRQATSMRRPRIAMLTGHREASGMSVMDMVNAWKELYDVEEVTIGERIDALSRKVEGMNYRVKLAGRRSR